MISQVDRTHGIHCIGRQHTNKIIKYKSEVLSFPSRHNTPIIGEYFRYPILKFVSMVKKKKNDTNTIADMRFSCYKMIILWMEFEIAAINKITAIIHWSKINVPSQGKNRVIQLHVNILKGGCTLRYWIKIDLSLFSRSDMSKYGLCNFCGVGVQYTGPKVDSLVYYVYNVN